MMSAIAVNVAAISVPGLSLQDSYWEALRREHSPVTIFLLNGIRLQGEIVSFDQYSVLLKKDSVPSVIYKHAIATVRPGDGAIGQRERM